MPAMTSSPPDTETLRALLHDTQKWMRVAGSVGLVVSLMLSAFFLVSLLTETVENSRDVVTLLIRLVDLPCGVLINVLWLRQANRLRDFLDTGDERQYLAALVAQRSSLRAVAFLVLSAGATIITAVSTGVF